LTAETKNAVSTAGNSPRKVANMAQAPEKTQEAAGAAGQEDDGKAPEELYFLALHRHEKLYWYIQHDHKGLLLLLAGGLDVSFKDQPDQDILHGESVVRKPEAYGITEASLRRALNRLAKRRHIDVRSTPRGRRIKVLLTAVFDWNRATEAAGRAAKRRQTEQQSGDVQRTKDLRESKKVRFSSRIEEEDPRLYRTRAAIGR